MYRNFPKHDILEVCYNYARQVSKLNFQILSDFSKIKFGKPLEIINKVLNSNNLKVSQKLEVEEKVEGDLYLVLDLDETLIHFKYVQIY